MTRRIVAALAIGLGPFAAHACSNVEPLAEFECGNGVLEFTEDCEYDSNEAACHPPGSEHECRFECSDEVACPTPYRCGDDGVCRVSSGTMTLVLTIDDASDALATGDFDGDGSTDVLSATLFGTSSISYLDGFVESDTADFPFAFAERSFAVGHLTTDELSDIAFVAFGSTGVNVARGTEDRVLEGTAYPTFQIPAPAALAFAAELTPNQIGSEPLTLVDLGCGSGILLLRLLQGAGEPTDLMTPPGVLPGLGGDTEPSVEGVQVGRLAPLNPCDQYAVAVRGVDQVFVGTLCTKNGAINGDAIVSPEMVCQAGAADIPIPLLEVPLEGDCASLQVDRAFLIDVDADAALDVVVTPLEQARAAPCVVRGPFQFPEGADAAVVGPSELYPILRLEGSLENGSGGKRAYGDVAGERVLAMEHLNDDTIPDFVTTYGIFTSQSFPCPENIAAHGGEDGVFHCHRAGDLYAYVDAAIGDSDKDGILDIAMASAYDERLEVFRGAGGDTFSPYTAEVDGLARDLVFDDFDGDGYDDLVFSDRPCLIGESCTDTVRIAYGWEGGGLEETRTIGSLGITEQLIASDLPKELFSGIDGASELVGIGRDADSGILSFAVLFGNTDRQLQAPFLIIDEGPAQADPDPDDADPYTIDSVALGRFVEKVGETGDYVVQQSESSQLDIAAFAEAPDARRFWLLATEAEAELSSSAKWFSEPVDEWRQSLVSGYLEARSLDTDPTDELVYAAGGGLAIGDVELREADEEVSQVPFGVGVRQILELPDELVVSASGFFPTEPIDTFSSKSGGDSLLVEDIDGDGAADIALLTIADDGAPFLVVLWNQSVSAGADGDWFSTTSDESSERELAISILELSGQPTTFVGIPLDDAPGFEILVAESAAQIMPVEGTEPVAPANTVNAYRFDGRTLAKIGSIPGLEPVVPIRAMVSADFDEDGVYDLVVAHENEFALYRNLPRHDLR